MLARDSDIGSHEWRESQCPNAKGVAAGLEAGDVKSAVGIRRGADDEARIRRSADTDRAGRDRLPSADRNDAAADLALVRRGGLCGVGGCLRPSRRGETEKQNQSQRRCSLQSPRATLSTKNTCHLTVYVSRVWFADSTYRSATTIRQPKWKKRLVEAGGGIGRPAAEAIESPGRRSSRRTAHPASGLRQNVARAHRDL